MSDLFDTTPFVYVGNDKKYKELSKEELKKLKEKNIEKEALPSSEEVDESVTSVIGPMRPQAGFEGTEEPSTDNILADVDTDAELLKESLSDIVNGGEIYFEAANFIEKLKEKFKKNDANDTKNIDNAKLMNVAKSYTEMKLASIRVKLLLIIDADSKVTSNFKTLQKKVIECEKKYRSLRKDLNKDENNMLNKYINEFDKSINEKTKVIISDINDMKKTTIKTESAKPKQNPENMVNITSLKDKILNNILNSASDIDSIDKNKIKEIGSLYFDFSYFKNILKYYDSLPDNIKNNMTQIDVQNKIVGVEKDMDKQKNALNPREKSLFTSDISDAISKNLDTEFKKFTSEDKDITESCDDLVNEECGSNIVTEKDIDPVMKPLIEKLNRKGYQTVASSSGHKNVIKPKDIDKDNVYEDHYYGDARLVFKGKYDLGKAPKYWYWKKVDNADEVEYLDVMQIKRDDDVSKDSPESFNTWKTRYMDSLTNWVNDLPDISDKKDVEEACHTESANSDAINDAIIALQNRIERNERLQAQWEAKYGSTNESLYQQHEKLCDQMEALCDQRRNAKESVDDIDDTINTLFESVINDIEFDVFVTEKFDPEKVADTYNNVLNAVSKPIPHAIAKMASKNKSTEVQEKYQKAADKASAIIKTGLFFTGQYAIFKPFDLLILPPMVKRFSESDDPIDKLIAPMCKAITSKYEAIKSKATNLFKRNKDKEITEKDFIEPYKKLQLQGLNVAKEIDSVTDKVNELKEKKEAVKRESVSIDDVSQYLINEDGVLVENAFDILQEMVETIDYNEYDVFPVIEYFIDILIDSDDVLSE